LVRASCSRYSLQIGSAIKKQKNNRWLPLLERVSIVPAGKFHRAGCCLLASHSLQSRSAKVNQKKTMSISCRSDPLLGVQRGRSHLADPIHFEFLAVSRAVLARSLFNKKKTKQNSQRLAPGASARRSSGFGCPSDRVARAAAHPTAETVWPPAPDRASSF
jgi:hypothetical protein